jgi:hypothetical protein
VDDDEEEVDDDKEEVDYDKEKEDENSFVLLEERITTKRIVIGVITL